MYGKGKKFPLVLLQVKAVGWICIMRALYIATKFPLVLLQVKAVGVTVEVVEQEKQSKRFH